MHDLESFFDSDDDEEEQIDGGMLTEIAQFKEGYYKEKFGFANVDKWGRMIGSCYQSHLVVAIEMC